MHNNGTNRIILPERGPVLGSVAQPQSGIHMEVNAMGVMIHPFVGDQAMNLQLDPQTATQLGVNLISAVALGRAGAAQAKPAPSIIVPEEVVEEAAEASLDTPTEA